MGFFGSKVFLLKPEVQVQIRDADLSDASSLKSFFETMTRDGDGQVLEFGEIDLTLSQEKRWIKSVRANANELVLVATIQHQIIGLIEIQQEKRRKLNHCGVLAMGITPEWRNRGLGKIMLRELLLWYQEYSTLWIIHLNVLANNERAIRLYESSGFSRDGVRREYVRLGPNQFVDEVLMSRKVNLPLNLNDEPS